MNSTKGEINPQYDEQDGYDPSTDRYPPGWEARKQAVKKRDDWRCQDCGITVGQDKMLMVRHITPLKDGGSNRLENLEFLCVDCHNDRHDHDIREGLNHYQTPPGLWDRL